MARNFFEQIKDAPNPVTFIRGLINPTSPTYEKDWLDFKQQPSCDLKHPKWREMWVEALAGFANNQGGVIIWGIDARKDAGTNVDAASGENPVNNPNGVKSRLIELQRQATDPPLMNVVIEAYEIPSAPGTGFVVCFVPEGPFKPYRAEDGRKSQYVIRAGDNFVVMSRSMLQAMFYPRSQAVFRARADLSWQLLERVQTSSGDYVAEMICTVELVNDGTATGRNPLVQVQPVVGTTVRLPGRVDGIKFFSEGWIVDETASGTVLEATRPLHPGRVTPLFTATWRVEARGCPSMNGMVLPDCHAPSLELTVYCENQEQQVIKLQFDINELISNRRCCVEAMPVE
jgi:hypothetical protein